MKRTELKFPRELITSIDMTNTLNGGTSQPLVRHQKFQAYHQILLRIPGIEAGNIKIEVNNNQLMIYYFTPMITQDRYVKFPKVLYNEPIPYYVDVTKIAATEEELTLIVKLPFNEFAEGYHKDISVS